MEQKPEGIRIGRKGRLMDANGFDTPGQEIIDKANETIHDFPLRGTRFRRDEPETKPGPVIRIKPGEGIEKPK